MYFTVDETLSLLYEASSHLYFWQFLLFLFFIVIVTQHIHNVALSLDLKHAQQLLLSILRAYRARLFPAGVSDASQKKLIADQKKLTGSVFVIGLVESTILYTLLFCLVTLFVLQGVFNFFTCDHPHLFLSEGWKATIMTFLVGVLFYFRGRLIENKDRVVIRMQVWVNVLLVMAIMVFLLIFNFYTPWKCEQIQKRQLLNKTSAHALHNDGISHHPSPPLAHAQQEGVSMPSGTQNAFMNAFPEELKDVKAYFTSILSKVHDVNVLDWLHNQTLYMSMRLNDIDPNAAYFDANNQSISPSVYLKSKIAGDLQKSYADVESKG